MDTAALDASPVGATGTIENRQGDILCHARIEIGVNGQQGQVSTATSCRLTRALHECGHYVSKYCSRPGIDGRSSGWKAKLI